MCSHGCGFVVALNSLWLDMFHTLDDRLGDYFVRQYAHKLSPDPDIVIVDIDEASIAAMQDSAGSWPWPRAVHAELLQGIARQQPGRSVRYPVQRTGPLSPGERPVLQRSAA
jgi:adenylate cyclase